MLSPLQRTLALSSMVLRYLMTCPPLHRLVPCYLAWLMHSTWVTQCRDTALSAAAHSFWMESALPLECRTTQKSGVSRYIPTISLVCLSQRCARIHEHVDSERVYRRRAHTHTHRCSCTVLIPFMKVYCEAPQKNNLNWLIDVCPNFCLHYIYIGVLLLTLFVWAVLSSSGSTTALHFNRWTMHPLKWWRFLVTDKLSFILSTPLVLMA